MQAENRRTRTAAKTAVLIATLSLAACAFRAGAEEAASSKGTNAPTSSAPAPSNSAAPAPPKPIRVTNGKLDLKVAKPGSDEAEIATVLATGLLPRSGGGFGLDRLAPLPGQGPGGSRAVRVAYPVGSASARSANRDGSSYGGAQAYLLLPYGPVDAATLSYCLRFPAGFDFVKGGKLPGLFGGTVTSGRRIPDGTDGWSTRYMWRTGGAGEVYAYLPSSVEHGTSLGRGTWSVATGRWQCLAQTVVLNTPGRSDGSITLKVDGKQVFAASALVFRTTPALRIDGVFFSTFFGGGDPSWASPRDQHADFARISVTPLAAK